MIAHFLSKARIVALSVRMERGTGVTIAVSVFTKTNDPAVSLPTEISVTLSGSEPVPLIVASREPIISVPAGVNSPSICGANLFRPRSN